MLMFYFQIKHFKLLSTVKTHACSIPNVISNVIWDRKLLSSADWFSIASSNSIKINWSEKKGFHVPIPIQWYEDPMINIKPVESTISKEYYYDYS